MSEHTPGALRAAEAIADNEREHFSAVIQIYAEIIDRETGLPDLLKALERISRLDKTGLFYEDGDRDYMYSSAQAIARTAIAKAKGETDV